VELDFIPLSKATAKLLDAIGTWAFFIIIGAFAVWVIGIFVVNTNILRARGLTT
jgi:hypothetical protein